jgi:VWFA-related protein
MFSLALLFPLTAFGQTPRPAPVPSPTPPAEDDVVKISTTLIQVDVVATDKDGNQIKDLKPEDFEIYENGDKQSVKSLSYIPITVEERTEQSKTPSKNQPYVPTTPLKPEQVRRSIAIVVDDLSLTFGGADAVRDALRKYVDQQMQPGDLVAIIRTAGGIGTLQQFTTDKRMLYAAIEKIRWYPTGRGRVGDFAPIEPNFKEILSGVKDLSGDGEQTGGQPTAEQARQTREMNDYAERYRDDIFTAGTLGAINYVIRGMKDLPGRKSLLLYSSGFPLIDRDREGRVIPNVRMTDGVRRLIDLANRASVVIYTADARGLIAPGATGQDDTFGISNEGVGNILEQRRNELRDTQEGLRFLAEETGGRAFINNNDLNAAIRKTLDEQRGYYLLAYEPDAETFKPEERKFNKLTIKVTRPGVKIRYRSGFFGIADKQLDLLPQNSSRQIIKAITSPFEVADIGLRMNSIFINDQKQGNVVQSYVHVQGGNISFTDEPDGWKKASFEMLAITFGDNGNPVDQANKLFTIRVKEDNYKKILSDGLVYMMEVPIKKPGAYQLRIALRDNSSGKVGSASKFVEVPDIKKKKIALSGIALENFTDEEWQKISNGWATSNSSQQPPQDSSLFDKQSDASLRRYKRNTIMSYGFIVYNSKGNKPENAANLQSQIKLYRDGNVVLEGKFQKISAAGQTDLTRVFSSGAVSLGKDLTVGNYVLQIVVNDGVSNDKDRTTSQWIDFEIIE